MTKTAQPAAAWRDRADATDHPGPEILFDAPSASTVSSLGGGSLSRKRESPGRIGDEDAVGSVSWQWWRFFADRRGLLELLQLPVQATDAAGDVHLFDEWPVNSLGRLDDRFLQAASRRAPVISAPWGVMTTGCSKPTLALLSARDQVAEVLAVPLPEPDG